jgi:hypothetical protein
LFALVRFAGRLRLLPHRQRAQGLWTSRAAGTGLCRHNLFCLNLHRVHQVHVVHRWRHRNLAHLHAMNPQRLEPRHNLCARHSLPIHTPYRIRRQQRIYLRPLRLLHILPKDAIYLLRTCGLQQRRLFLIRVHGAAGERQNHQTHRHQAG